MSVERGATGGERWRLHCEALLVIQLGCGMAGRRSGDGGVECLGGEKSGRGWGRAEVRRRSGYKGMRGGCGRGGGEVGRITRPY